METNGNSSSYNSNNQQQQQHHAQMLSSSGEKSEPLIDPKLLEGLNESERKEALAAAAAARRAEERAEQRAIQRALQQREQERKLLFQQQNQQQLTSIISNNRSTTGSDITSTMDDRVVFVSKKQRLKSNGTNGNGSHNNDTTALTQQQLGNKETKIKDSTHRTSSGTASSSMSSSAAAATLLSENEMKIIRETYLGKAVTGPDEADAKKKKPQQKSFSKKITFKFRWDETDDTYNDDDPLYNPSLLTQQHQQQKSARPGRYNNSTNYGSSNNRNDDTNNSSSLLPKKRKQVTTVQDRLLGNDSLATVTSVTNKPLHLMTTRDWRILRENYEIIVKGGKVPPPMRSFRESPLPNEIPTLHPALLSSIDTVFRFKEPSPIQRQAIPIGLQRRDLIGIAETGSGKTIAFGVPLCQYILSLPSSVLNGVADNGPLGIVMAPTRELAIQIDNELQKLLSKQKHVTTYAVVGGQPIQHQAQVLRAGIHILVGTPGRINDCIDMAYLVLNQCCYIVMDEADRMIDMGFAPQMESILNAMGGLLKSENEAEAYEQEVEDLKKPGVARYRITAMFSATMPMEVERMAKQYLRHPAIISIGNPDSAGKNTRIVQKIVWVANPTKKEDALRNLIRDPRFLREKVIVFVNEKKHADMVGRMVERAGRQCVVLHGGKSQEQREENLELFRRGGIVMVATDVAGRGLDIPDVAHVINYDLPTRSIENYSHRIGRTGRAGKEGYATSLISEEDSGIMAPLRAYLESTGNDVPDRLAKHPSAQNLSQQQQSILY